MPTDCHGRCFAYGVGHYGWPPNAWRSSDMGTLRIDKQNSGPGVGTMIQDMISEFINRWLADNPRSKQ